MKKFLAALFCVVLLLSLCSCALTSKPLRYARDCWEEIGSATIEVDHIYFMEYNTRTSLSDEAPDTDIFSDIPSRGYAIIFDSSVFHSGEAFMDSYACFLNTEGELEFVFDYEESYRLYEANYANFSIYNTDAGRRALEYLSNCNYISHMINYAFGSEELDNSTEKNIWYALSEEQIQQVVGK